MTASVCSDAVICFYRSFRSAAGMSFDRLSQARSVSSVGPAFFLPDLAFPWISGTGGWSFLGCVWVRSGRFMPCFAMVHHLGVSMGGSAFDIPAAAASTEHLSVPIPQPFCRGAVPKCPYLPFHRLPHFLKFVLCHDVAAEACPLGRNQEFRRRILAGSVEKLSAFSISTDVGKGNILLTQATAPCSRKAARPSCSKGHVQCIFCIFVPKDQCYFTFRRSATGANADKKDPECGCIRDPVEVPPRFELGSEGFADLCLTTWPWHHMD